MIHPLTNFVFFGSSEFSVVVLETLKKSGFLPVAVVTTPDSPSGRGLKINSSPVKLWAIENKIDFLQPVRLDDNFSYKLQTKNYELFVVAAYGKIIPSQILALPKFGSFNIHPSLLPKYRGPSPLQSQILAGEENVGVTIIKMDSEVDHGEILAQQNFQFSIFNFQNKFNPPPSFVGLGNLLFEQGTKLLVENLPKLISGELKLEPQDDALATFTKKFSKADGEINLNNGKEAWLKYLALGEPVGVYFFAAKNGKKIRVKITEAKFENGQFTPVLVLPEGNKEMPYGDFLR